MDLETFRSNERLRFSYAQLMAMPDLHPPLWGEVVKVEEFYGDSAVRVWFDPSGSGHENRRPYQFTGVIERREPNPSTGLPSWQHVEYFNALRPAQHTTPLTAYLP